MTITARGGTHQQTAYAEDDVVSFLASRPSLDQLQEAHPTEYEAAREELTQLLSGGDTGALLGFLASSSKRPRPVRDRVKAKHVRRSEAIRRHIAVELVRQACLASSSGVQDGRVRFGLVNGLVLQRLLFERGLRRKPAPYLLTRLLWPLLSQRRFLMPLVMPQGIYCFYTRRLITALAGIIGERRCVEIAAGDGTLSRFLTARGSSVIATDDYSWDHAVAYDDTVVKMTAARALAHHQPQVVLCSWPPPGNTFERQVFATPSVELYILITTRHEFAAGNWADYRAQTGFEFREEPRLSRLLLPPDVDGVVYLFERRDPGER